MMIRQTLLIGGALIFSLSAGAQEPREIISRCVNALGGEEAIVMYSNFQGAGRTKLFGYGREFVGQFKVIKNENKIWERSDIFFGREQTTLIRAFDGEVAWIERKGNISDKPALNYLSDLKHTFHLLLKKEATVSRIEDTEIEGKKAYGIELLVDGGKTIFFIDRHDYTVLEMVFRDLYFDDTGTKEVLEKRVRYFDYQMFGSVLYPTRIVLYQKGQIYREYMFEKISFNPEISPAIFSRPHQDLDLRYSEERLY